MSDSVPVVEFPTVPSIMLFQMKSDISRHSREQQEALDAAIADYCDDNGIPAPFVVFTDGSIVIDGVLTPLPTRLLKQIAALKAGQHEPSPIAYQAVVG